MVEILDKWMKFAWWRWACQVRDSEVGGGKRGWWEYLLYEHVVGMIFAGESDPVHWTSIPIVCPHLPATRLTDSLGKFLPLAQVRQPRWAGSSTHFHFLFAGLGSWDGRKSSKSRRECLFKPRTCSNASLLVLQRIESAILTTQKNAQILKDEDVSDGKQTLTLSLTHKYIEFHSIFVLRWISCSLFVDKKNGERNRCFAYTWKTCCYIEVDIHMDIVQVNEMADS